MLSVRMVEPEDGPMLDAAAKADPFHSKIGLTGDYWNGKNTTIWQDDEGVVVALRTTAVARVDIQFLSQNFARNAKAVVQGFWRYVEVMRNRGIEELIFSSDSQAVIRFFGKRFNFRHLGGDTYSLRIK
jgi:hypothetical protein